MEELKLPPGKPKTKQVQRVFAHSVNYLRHEDPARSITSCVKRTADVCGTTFRTVRKAIKSYKDGTVFGTVNTRKGTPRAAKFPREKYGGLIR